MLPDSERAPEEERARREMTTSPHRGCVEAWPSPVFPFQVLFYFRGGGNAEIKSR